MSESQRGTSIIFSNDDILETARSILCCSLSYQGPKQKFTCPKSPIETIEKGVKYVQS